MNANERQAASTERQDMSAPLVVKGQMGDPNGTEIIHQARGGCNRKTELYFAAMADSRCADLQPAQAGKSDQP
jgi:hypothetical protein